MRNLVCIIVLSCVVSQLAAQEERILFEPGDTLQRTPADLTIDEMLSRGEQQLQPLALEDTLDTQGKKRDWSTWRPNIKRAMWLGLVLPGAGQIYNRKYWKLPIIYGGFVGCAYAMRWNNMMYRDYAQAYLDLKDDDPNTHSYEQFLHLGNQITESTKSRFEDLFKRRKDRYRRWGDMSFFVMVGVYALSVIDAYVDASLSEFDISKDLSLQWSPAIITDKATCGLNRPSAIGLQCSLSF